ncbi:MAG: hypothetical protein AB7T63_05380 [Planctomycetota bacterium]
MSISPVTPSAHFPWMGARPSNLMPAALTIVIAALKSSTPMPTLSKRVTAT